MTIKEIVKEYLEMHRFDGLAGDECGCEIDDLFPCDEGYSLKCEPGYRVPCDPQNCYADGDCPWHICTEKPEVK